MQPVYLAASYEAIGDNDNAFKYVDRMVQDHAWGVIGLKVDATWDPLRRDPRFDAVLARVGFPR
jgi:hypothetical protein